MKKHSFFSYPFFSSSFPENPQGRSSRFTLLEVVISLAILGVSLTVLLQFAADSQKRIGKSHERWRETHMLMQGAEYLLLHERAVLHVPERFFPYEDYRIECSYEEAEGLPEEYSSLPGQLQLYACRISLIRLSDGKEVDHVTVDRNGYDTELQEE